MEAYESDPAEWAAYAKFDQYRCARPNLDRGSWGAGLRSPAARAASRSRSGQWGRRGLPCARLQRASPAPQCCAFSPSSRGAARMRRPPHGCRLFCSLLAGPPGLFRTSARELCSSFPLGRLPQAQRCRETPVAPSAQAVRCPPPLGDRWSVLPGENSISRPEKGGEGGGHIPPSQFSIIWPPGAGHLPAGVLATIKERRGVVCCCFSASAAPPKPI